MLAISVSWAASAAAPIPAAAIPKQGGPNGCCGWHLGEERPSNSSQPSIELPLTEGGSKQDQAETASMRDRAGSGGFLITNATKRRLQGWDQLSPKKCNELLRDDAGLMRTMWGPEAFTKRIWDDQPACWDRHREGDHGPMIPDWYFDAAIKGLSCGENWFEGNEGWIGKAFEPPKFERAAPALFGFDESIEQFCANERGRPWELAHGGKDHGLFCVLASHNILSLYGTRVPYNLCRNLEWMVCAAKGMLPGQGGFGIRFSYEPRRLHTQGEKPFNHCSGWTPWGSCNEQQYGTDDIFFTEVCLFNQICKNNAELFTLKVGQFYVCEFDEDRFWELKRILMTPPTWGKH